MKLLAVIMILCSVPMAVSAASFYMCEKDGKKVISNVPCSQGREMVTRDIGIISGQDQAPAVAEENKSPLSTDTPSISKQRIRKPIQSDYDISHRVRERNGMVEVSGRITGPQCGSLKITAFSRSSDGGIIQCVDVSNLSGSSTLFSCSDSPARSSKGKKRDWFVSNIFVECQDL